MQTDLVKIAHQLIETANLLIKAASEQETVVITGGEIIGHKYNPSPISGMLKQIEEDVFDAKPSKRSQFSSRAEKVQHIRDEMKECEQIMLNSKSTNQISTAQKRLQALRGHLTKAMNQPSAAKETRWKSQV
jgi:hypothetical protein